MHRTCRTGDIIIPPADTEVVEVCWIKRGKASLRFLSREEQHRRAIMAKRAAAAPRERGIVKWTRRPHVAR